MQIESKKHFEVLRSALFEYMDPDSPYSSLRSEEKLQTANELFQAIDCELRKIEE